MILLTVLSLPFMLREPIDLPPIVSVELIQISDKTNIPFAPKARKIIEDTKKKEIERLRELVEGERVYKERKCDLCRCGYYLTEEDDLWTDYATCQECN